MSIVKSFGYTDTPISGVSELTFPRGLVNYKADWRVKSQTGKESVITNLTTPLDQPEKIRIAFTEVSNIYAGSGVEASVASPTKKGVSVLAQLTQVVKITDTADPDFCVELPLSFHIVMKVPTSAYLTADDVQTSLGRLISGVFDTGSTSTARLNALFRGSLLPSDM